MTRVFYATINRGSYKWYQCIGTDFGKAVKMCIALHCPMHVMIKGVKRND